MKPFMDKNFLLSNETAQKLYFDYAATTPVLDYHMAFRHCHIHSRMSLPGRKKASPGRENEE